MKLKLKSGLDNGLGDIMDFIIAFSQIILAIIFLFTLRCEVSKDCSDSVLYVCVRAFIMCSSAIAFFLLFEPKYHNISFFIIAAIPIVVGVIYSRIEVGKFNILKHI